MHIYITDIIWVNFWPYSSSKLSAIGSHSVSLIIRKTGLVLILKNNTYTSTFKSLHRLLYCTETKAAAAAAAAMYIRIFRIDYVVAAYTIWYCAVVCKARVEGSDLCCPSPPKKDQVPLPPAPMIRQSALSGPSYKRTFDWRPATLQVLVHTLYITANRAVIHTFFFFVAFQSYTCFYSFL